MDGIEANSEGRVAANQGKRIRRHWTTEIKRRIVREAEKPGAVRQHVAERHGVELTRFGGHPNVSFGGVRDGKQNDPVHTGV